MDIVRAEPTHVMNSLYQTAGGEGFPRSPGSDLQKLKMHVKRELWNMEHLFLPIWQEIVVQPTLRPEKNKYFVINQNIIQISKSGIFF
jgi:hypothetical protein